jgi:hypothetical protein
MKTAQDYEIALREKEYDLTEAEEKAEAEKKSEYWKYYQKAMALLQTQQQYKFQISAASPTGYAWYKILDRPKNFEDLSKGNTKYLSPDLLASDYETLQDWVLDNCDDDFKFFQYVLPIVSLGEGDERSKIRRAIISQLNLEANAEVSVQLLHSTRVSETLPEYVTSFIPEKDQFNISLRQSGLTYKDFLMWFYGDAERESFALHVGRAGLGPQGSTLAGELDAVQHSYRQAIIIKGMPLIGKSFFNEFLVKGFHHCGLKTAVIQDLNTRFGHGEWLSAAWSYADDTTKSMLQAFYNSPILKTACSNGLLKSENKGKDSFAIKAVCAPVLLANDTDSRDSAKADSGNANRIRVLSTISMESAKHFRYPDDSILEGCPNGLPAEVINFLCKKLAAEPEELAAYFIRLCVDYFNSFTLLELLDKCNDLGNTLYSRSNATNLQNLANAAVWSALICAGDDTDYNSWPEIYNSAMDSSKFIFDTLQKLAMLRCANKENPLFKIRAALYLDYLEQGKPSTHPYCGFEAYSFTALLNLATHINVYARELDNTGLDVVTHPEVFAKIFKGLVDVQGVSSSYSLATMQEKWRDSLFISYKSLRDTANRVYKRLVDEGDYVDCRYEGLKPYTFDSLKSNCMSAETIFKSLDYKELTAFTKNVKFITM